MQGEHIGQMKAWLSNGSKNAKTRRKDKSQTRKPSEKAKSSDTMYFTSNWKGK